MLLCLLFFGSREQGREEHAMEKKQTNPNTFSQATGVKLDNDLTSLKQAVQLS